MTERLHFHFSLSCIGDRNGHPLQCSCLENPRDSGAWWAAIYGLTQSRTQLSDLAAAAEKPSFSTLPKVSPNSLQHSCLENPRDGGAWWAAVYGVAQSRTRLKRLSSSHKLYISLFYIIVLLCVLQNDSKI